MYTLKVTQPRLVYYFKATQSKISQKLGLQIDIAFDLNDIIIDNGHLHQWM